MAFREISVKILGDSRDLERAFDRSSKAATDFNRKATGGTLRAEVGLGNLRKQALGLAGGYLAVSSAATAFGEGLQYSIDAASNLNEQISKSEVVFGSSADEVEDWSKATARNIGVAQDEALAAAATFGNLFSTLGIGAREASEMSRGLVTLAADLASFNNTSSDDALIALRSGLVGEAEPLRRYGVRLSEARVQQLALAESGKKSVKSLTDQEKTLARYQIILEDTTTAQGDFARTQEGFAQQTKILRAEMRDLSAAIGNFAIPILTDLVSVMNDGFTAAGLLSGKLRELKDLSPLPEPVEKASVSIWKEVVLRLNPATAAYKNVKLAIDLVNRALRETPSAAAEGLAAMDRIESHRAARDPGELPETTGTAGAALTPEQRRRFFDARVARELERVQDIPTLKGQVARLREIAAQVQAKIKLTKDVTRKMDLQVGLERIQRDIRATQATIAANARKAEQDALDHEKELARLAKERAEAAKERVANLQFAALGLGPGGADAIPGVGALQKRLGRMFEEEGLPAKSRKLMETMRTILAGGMGAVSEEVRSKMEQMLAGIDQALDQHAKKRRRPRYRIVSSDAMLAGLGLSPEEIRRLSSRMAGADRFGRIPLGGQAAFGQRVGGTGSGAVYVTGPVTIKTDNPDVIARELQKRARRTASQTRGARPGTRQSLDG